MIRTTVCIDTTIRPLYSCLKAEVRVDWWTAYSSTTVVLRSDLCYYNTDNYAANDRR